MRTQAPNDPWDQQPGESARAYAAFAAYRDAGPAVRSIDALYRRQHKGGKEARASGTWTRWSSKFRWTERARAWDAEVDRVRREAMIREVEEMARRHARIGKELLDRALRRLESTPETEMSLALALRAIEVGVRIERQARGEPTERERLARSERSQDGDPAASLPDLILEIAARMDASRCPPGTR